MREQELTLCTRSHGFHVFLESLWFLVAITCSFVQILISKFQGFSVLMFASLFVFFLPHMLSIFLYHQCISQVYDVTKYLDDHPGGDDVLLSATGNH